MENTTTFRFQACSLLLLDPRSLAAPNAHAAFWLRPIKCNLLAISKIGMLFAYDMEAMHQEAAQAQYYVPHTSTHIDYIPHTTTHYDHVRHGNHYDVVPHTTTHLDAVPHRTTHRHR